MICNCLLCFGGLFVAEFLQLEMVVFKVLIIDDEPSVGDALKLVLEEKGYEVVLVNNGRDGLEISRKQQFAFAIVDLYLTDAYGLDLIKEIHQRQPQLPMLLITGHGSPEVFAAARRFGAVGALSKPFQPAEILALIAKSLDQ
jgi:DNA-binding NtrC family response regulator